MTTETNLLDKDELKEKFGRAMGRISNGVYVMTMKRKAGRDGMLCTWLSQVAFEPPLISIAVKAERPILGELKENDSFVVNVLCKGSSHVFKNFVKADLPGEERFEGLACEPDETHGRILQVAVSYLACKVRKHVPAGDHVLVIAEVVDGALLNEESEPMVHLRKTGFQY